MHHLVFGINFQIHSVSLTIVVSIHVLHFNFLFVPCGRLSWLPVSFLLHVKHTLSYRMCGVGALSQDDVVWTCESCPA